MTLQFLTRQIIFRRVLKLVTTLFRSIGRRQSNTYLNALEKRFGWLAENPKSGTHRTDVAEGYYSFPRGEYVVFRMMGEKGIDIIGIPHREMNIIVTYCLPD